MASCDILQKSLDWCMGTPELPGIKRKIYFVSKGLIANYPTLATDSNGRPTTSTYTGNFTLVADATWKFIIVLADQSTLTSEPQGDVPSQTQLNKLVAVHPGVGAEAAEAAAYLNNGDNIFIVEDMKGKFRVVGSERWMTKTTVAQDNGQGATGTTSTTIEAEATDVIPAPFYTGTLEIEEGTLDCSTGEITP